MKDGLTPEARILLVEWSNWRGRDSDCIFLGYPRQDITQKNSPASSQTAQIQQSDRVKLVEKALLMLKRRSNDCYEALIYCFMNRNWSDRLMGRKLNVTTQEAKILRVRAEGYFLAIIDALME